MKQGHRCSLGSAMAMVLAAALTMILLGVQGALAQGNTIYVDVDAMGESDGTSWDDAYLDLQLALDAAVAGDQIWVAEGTYTPTAEYGGIGDRYRSFQMKNGVAIYGGFDPSAGDVAWGDRDWVNHETILSGDLNGDDGPDFENNDENSYHVFYHPAAVNLDSSAVLDGFIVSGGNANGGSDPQYAGGGMYNEGSSPALAHCTFSGNSSMQYGGGMYNHNDSSPLLVNCEFNGNSSTIGGGICNSSASPTLTDCGFAANTAYNGGGMYNLYSSPVLSNCIFEGNPADGYGGGMSNSHSSPNLEGCAFTGNSAANGGGVFNYSDSSPTLTHCTFMGNSASEGGGMHSLGGAPTLRECTFEDNSGVWGGGMYNVGSSPILSDCIFSGNEGVFGAGGMHNLDASPALSNCIFEGNVEGGMYNDSGVPTLTNCVFANNLVYGMLNRGGSAPRLTNCTFWGNWSEYNGGAVINKEGSTPALTNCILWGNTPDEIINQDPGTMPVVTYSDVQGGYHGEGNINTHPLFVDPGNGGFYLLPDSPCIDAGDNDAPGLAGVITDGAGNPRFVDVLGVPDTGNGAPPIVDMGAYEAIPGVIFVDEDASGANVGRSWNDAYTTLQPALEVAVAGDQIWVAAGAYTPTQEASFGDPRSATFEMKNGVGLYGGFDPTVGDVAFEDRDWEANPTLLSGDLSGDDGPDFEGNDENSYHVFYHPDGTGLDATAILDGFVITGGNADSSVPHNQGAGMYNCSGSSPTLTNCTFAGNSSSFDGGGMFNIGGSSPTLTNCTFQDNAAGYEGGGMFNSASSPTLIDCAFRDNWGASEGGGMYNGYGSSPSLINCAFAGNSSGSGGGMYNAWSSSPSLTNCAFTGNSAVYNGGGIYNWNESSPTLTNCILWGDSPQEIFNYDETNSPVVAYSNIQGGCGAIPHNDCGAGNIDSAPLFVDASNGDFHLSSDSPCIDVGSNEAPGLPDHDFEGDPRVMDGNGDGMAVVDMGVDEVFGYHFYLPLVLKDYP